MIKKLTAFSTVVSGGVGGDGVKDYSRLQYSGNGEVEGRSLVRMGAETRIDFIDKRAIFDGIFQSYVFVIMAFVIVVETEWGFIIKFSKDMYEQESLRSFEAVFEDLMAELKNLKRDGTMQHYQELFEATFK
nr:vacuole protein [Tanacetum cinerariifolium]